jgi:Na+/H+ antiporter NhaC
MKLRRIAGYALWVIVMIVVAVANPEKNADYYGAWSMVPIVFVFVYILISTRVVEGFLWAGILGVFISSRGDILSAYPDELAKTLMDGDGLYMFELFLLLGIIYMLLKNSGVGTYFARKAATLARGPKSSMLLMTVSSIPLCIDDYLSAFTVGAAMSPINDRYKIPREMSAYVIRSSVTSPALFIPIGSWYIWCSFLMEENGLAEGMSATAAFAKVLPFLFYPIAILLVLLLVVFRAIPLFGSMKKAFRRVEEGGPVAPAVEEDDLEAEEIVEPGARVNWLHFIIPIALLFGLGFYFEFDMVKSLIWTSLASLVFYVLTGVFTVSKAIKSVYEGFAYMGELALMLVTGYSLARIAGDMGFTQYTVGITEGLISPLLFPFVVFVVFSITEFMVSFNWTLYLIAMPVIVALSESMGVNTNLAIGALISSGVWWYTGSFAADGGICAATACRVNIYRYNVAQIPYMLIVWVLSAIGYLVAGMLTA